MYNLALDELPKLPMHLLLIQVVHPLQGLLQPCCFSSWSVNEQTSNLLLNYITAISSRVIPQAITEVATKCSDYHSTNSLFWPPNELQSLKG